MNGLRIVESLSRPDSMITFKLSRDRVFRQRESIHIRHVNVSVKDFDALVY